MLIIRILEKGKKKNLVSRQDFFRLKSSSNFGIETIKFIMD